MIKIVYFCAQMVHNEGEVEGRLGTGDAKPKLQASKKKCHRLDW